MKFNHRWMARCAAIASLWTSWAGVAHAQTAEVIYQETFGFCTGSEGRASADQVRWRGLASGQRFGKPGFMKVYPYGSRNLPASVNSNLKGLSQGYTFWFRPVDGLLTATEEFSFDVRVLRDSNAKVEYLQRLSGIDPLSGAADRSRLALLIDGNWYISEETAPQTNGGVAWEGVSWTPSKLTYGVTPNVPGFGPSIPTSFTASLPESGIVTGFGVFVTKMTGRVRFDNYRILGVIPSGVTINTSPTTSSAEACPAGSPDRLGLPTPTPGPDIEIVDDSEVPPLSPTPGATPVETPVGGEPEVENVQFCPADERSKGPYVRFSKAALRKLLSAPRNPTALDLRDRAVIAALSNRNVRTGALSNVLISDYDQAKGLLLVPVGARGTVKALRLGGGARAALDRYLALVRSGAFTSSPLFLAQEAGTTALVGARAACLDEIRRLVRARVRQAKVQSQVTLLSRLPRGR